jgi:hypothetical protein
MIAGSMQTVTGDIVMDAFDASSNAHATYGMPMETGVTSHTSIGDASDAS